jgi:hypothetical protein
MKFLVGTAKICFFLVKLTMPLPFGNLIVLLWPERRFKPLVDLASIEESRSWLEVALTRANFDAVAELRSE